MKERFVPLSELLHVLWELYNTHYTGMIFITTPDDRSAQISLYEGAIVSVFYRNKHDMEALSLLGEIDVCRFRISKMPVKRRATSLPETVNILHYLKALLVDSRGDSHLSATIADVGLSDQIKATLQEELTKFLGPIAVMVCSEYLPKAKNIESAITALANEIPNVKEADEFRRIIKNKI